MMSRKRFSWWWTAAFVFCTACAVSKSDPHDVQRDRDGVPGGVEVRAETDPTVHNSQLITTVAGTGTEGFRGDGGPATSAELTWPSSVAVDGAGNVFLADYKNNRVRKVDTRGIITTVAGTGAAGFGGDDGPATNAQLNRPIGVTVDGIGNLFIADSDNHRIRKVNTSGIITTIAGLGGAGFSGDGGPATSARLNSPFGAAVDGEDNLWIVDYSNHRIRKVDTNGIITTVAGTGSFGFNGDGIPATNAQLWAPFGVAVDRAGNLFIADRNNHRIRKVDTKGIIATVAGTGIRGFGGDDGPATSARLFEPFGVAVDEAGNLFIADLRNQRIREVDTNGIITTLAGNGVAGFSGDDGPATNAQLNRPVSLVVDGAGSLFIADQFNHRIREVSLQE